MTWFFALSDGTVFGLNPVMRSLVVTSGLFKVAFDSKAGTNNAFQYATSLNPGNWQTLINNLGTGQRITNTIAIPTNNSLFFRVLVP